MNDAKEQDRKLEYKRMRGYMRWVQKNGKGSDENTKE